MYRGNRRRLQARQLQRAVVGRRQNRRRRRVEGVYRDRGNSVRMSRLMRRFIDRCDRLVDMIQLGASALKVP